MATLEKIRNRAGLLIGIVGFALFAFVFGDLQSCQTFFRQSQNKIAIVNGEGIEIQDFQHRLELASNNYKNSAGGTVTEEQQNAIRQMVFDEMIGSILLNKKSEEIGFVVGKEEEIDIIMGDNISPTIQQVPIFKNQQTGVFDKNALLQFIQVVETDDWTSYPVEMQQQLLSQKESWINLKKNVIEQRLLNKFSTLIMSAVVANSLDAKASSEEHSINVDFNIVSQPFNAIPDSEVEVSDSEIAKLYESRKNNFKQERAQVINYIAVNITPSETDYSDVLSRMENLRDELANSENPIDIINDNSDVPFLDAYVSESHLGVNFRHFAENASIGDVDGPVLVDKTYNMHKLLSIKYAPDSIKVNQIVFPGSDESIYKSIIDSIANVIRSGRSFSDVSLDETNGQSNGDMGWYTESNLASGIDANFAKVLFNAKLNEVFTITSSFGTHLVQIVDNTKPVKKYKIATISMEVTPSPLTYNKLYSDLNQYISKNNTLDKFKSAAQDAGYVCMNDIHVLENQNNISNIGESRQVIRWAYENKKGSVSDIFECQNYFVAVALEGEVKAGFRPLAEVSDILKRELITSKKGEKAVETLKSKNLKTLEDYAEAMNSNVQEVKFVTFSTPRISGVGTDPIVNVYAISSEVDKITGPFVGKNGIYVLSLTNKTKNDQVLDIQQQKQQMNMQNSYKLVQVLQNNSLLKDKANVEDNRSRFY